MSYMSDLQLRMLGEGCDTTEDVTQEIKPGQILVYEDALRALEDQIRYLIWRGSHYGGHNYTQSAYLEMLDDLAKRVRSIRTGAQHE